MPIDGIMLRAVCDEINRCAAGSRVDKIAQPEKDEVLLFLRAYDAQTHQGCNMKLLLSADPSAPRVCFSSRSYENLDVPPNFCMLLRKHLTGARLICAEQPGLERVLVMRFDCRTEMREQTQRNIIVEIMGRCANIFLTSGDEHILGQIRQSDLTTGKRPLLPGMKYILPPSQGKSDFLRGRAGCESYAGQEGLERYLCGSFVGLSPLVCREISYRVSGRCDYPCSQLTDDMRAALTRELDKTASIIENSEYNPVVLYGDGPAEFYCTDIMQYGQTYTKKFFDSPSRAVEAFYAERAAAEHIRRMTSDINKLIQTNISRLSRKIEAQTGDMERYTRSLSSKTYADIIMSNLHSIPINEDSVDLPDYTCDPVRTVRIGLDKRLTPVQNAQRYYKLYKKSKTAIAVLTEQLSASREELEYLDSVREALRNCVCIADINDIRSELSQQGYIKTQTVSSRRSKSSRTSVPMRFISTDGFVILSGKNNIQNDELTFRQADKNDWWFHVKDYPGSHVIIKCDGAVPPDSTFTEAAVIAATYSGAKDSKKVSVDYTQVKNVKKPPGAKPGSVIYHMFSTAVVDPSTDLARRLNNPKT